jgi:hypothetical protein
MIRWRLLNIFETVSKGLVRGWSSSRWEPSKAIQHLTVSHGRIFQHCQQIRYDSLAVLTCLLFGSSALDCGGRLETKELRFTLCDQSFFQLSPIFASKRRMEGMHFLDGDKWSPSTNLFAIVRLTHARCQSVRLFNTTVARALDLAICTFFAALNGGLSTVGGNHGLGRGNSGKIEMVSVGLRRLRLLC